MTTGRSVIFLPGLGADARLFRAQKRRFPSLRVMRWLRPRQYESLPAYGRRMAERLREEPEPFVIGGASFGGMVALEMARHCSARAVVLIGSALSGREIPSIYRVTEILARPVPPYVVRPLLKAQVLMQPIMGIHSAPSRRLFAEMVADADLEFIRWGARAILNWEPESLPDVAIHRIHGDRDLLIPRKDFSGTHKVAGGGHLIAMTHAKQVNDFLARVI